MELKDVLKNFREKNKISQRELARRCDLSNSLISILEMGTNPQTGKKMSPDLVTYKKLASGMGISLQFLMESLDETELVSLSFDDFARALEQNEEENIPQTKEAKIISAGIDKMSPERREQALKVLQTIFADYFDGGKEDET